MARWLSADLRAIVLAESRTVPDTERSISPMATTRTSPKAPSKGAAKRFLLNQVAPTVFGRLAAAKHPSGVSMKGTKGRSVLVAKKRSSGDLSPVFGLRPIQDWGSAFDQLARLWSWTSPDSVTSLAARRDLSSSTRREQRQRGPCLCDLSSCSI